MRGRLRCEPWEVGSDVSLGRYAQMRGRLRCEPWEVGSDVSLGR